MENIKYRHLKFIPTGNVFKMSEKDAVKILRSDRGNYEIVDKDFIDDDTADTAKTSTYEQVVIDNEEDNADETDTLEKMTVVELTAYCDENKIEYNKRDKKAEIIAKILKAAENTEKK